MFTLIYSGTTIFPQFFIVCLFMISISWSDFEVCHLLEEAHYSGLGVNSAARVALI